MTEFEAFFKDNFGYGSNPTERDKKVAKWAFDRAKEVAKENYSTSSKGGWWYSVDMESSIQSEKERLFP